MTIPIALKLFLDQFLGNQNCMPWHTFREELIWTLEVDDLIKAN